MTAAAKDRLIGVTVTLVSSAIMYLTFTFFGSFETRAASETKYHKLDRKLDLVLCYLKPKHCIKE
jgi:hypothetical protein